MESVTFTKNGNGGVRNAGAFRAPEFDISRRVGGGKAMDIPSPRALTETDRSLARSRQLIERLRLIVAER